MLDLTPKEIVERQGLRINPAKTCQPIGAMYAALGIHNCLPHSHGSQGCCSFHRSHLTRHYREPIMASTSSFTEGSSVFGGGSNLKQALQTIFTTYKPDVVAVSTTCLSETIGDDIPTFIRQAREDGFVPEDKWVIHANTPSYVGSHINGWSTMTRAMVNYFSTKSNTSTHKINVIPGYVEPSDVRAIKQLVTQLGVEAITFPDVTDVVDTPQTGDFQMYPKGGTTIEDLHLTGDSLGTIALGTFASEGAAIALQEKCKVPYRLLELPIGLKATDRFVEAVMEFTGITPPDSVTYDRGRLVDVMTDMQQYLYRKRVAVYGDPDQIIPLTEFLVTCGMLPVYVITGTPGKRFEERINEILKDVVPNAVVRQNADLFYLHQLIKNEPVDLLIGNEYGKYIARAEDIPIVRFGFPILDRIGHSYFPTSCYWGGIYLLSQIINTILERIDRDAPDELFELVR